MPARRWTDAQLREALATCTTWTAVYALLGLRGRSDAVRNRADALGLAYDHIGTPESRRRWTDAQLTDAVAASTNLRQVFVALGLAVGGGTWMAMQDHICRLGLSTTHWDRPVGTDCSPGARTSPSWSDDEVRRAAQGARSVAQVMRRLGLDPRRRRGRSATERRLRELGIDIARFPGQGWSAGTRQPSRYRKPLDEVLVAGRAVSSTSALKHRLVAEGIFEWRCQLCGLTDWQGRHLALQLDHINGDRSDNRVDNLRLLCPNCHSQTDTFAGRNTANGYSPRRT